MEDRKRPPPPREDTGKRPIPPPPPLDKAPKQNTPHPFTPSPLKPSSSSSGAIPMEECPVAIQALILHEGARTISESTNFDLRTLELWTYIKLHQINEREDGLKRLPELELKRVEINEVKVTIEDDIATSFEELGDMMIPRQIQADAPTDTTYLDHFVTIISYCHYERIGEQFSWAMERKNEAGAKLQLAVGEGNIVDQTSLEDLMGDVCNNLAEVLGAKTYFFKDIVHPTKSTPRFFDVQFMAHARILTSPNWEKEKLQNIFLSHSNLKAYVERFDCKVADDGIPRRLTEDQTIGLLTHLASLSRDSLLGEGKYGSVYVVDVNEELHLQIPHDRYAMKVTHQDLNSYAREVEALGLCRYNSFPKLYAFGQSSLPEPGVVGYKDGQGLVVMSMEGETLKTKLTGHPRFTFDEVLVIGVCLGYGLHLLHTHDDRNVMVYSDFKEDNIIFGQDGRAMLCDLGCWDKAGDEILTNRAPRYARVTKKPGTNIYVEPIIADPKDDVFALGSLLLLLSVGEQQLGNNSLRQVTIFQEEGKFNATIIQENVRESGCDNDEAIEFLEIVKLCLESDISAYEVVDRLSQLRDKIN